MSENKNEDEIIELLWSITEKLDKILEALGKLNKEDHDD